jgi:SAM-dependent methyltransferase
MSAPETCPICRAGGLRRSLEIPGLLVLRCAKCGHGLSRQPPPSGSDLDYHVQYDGGAFVDALRETRERQAALVIGAIRRHLSRPGDLLDVGAGRGWFLQACRREGIAPVAGVDTSELAVDGLRKAGLEAHLLTGEGVREEGWSRTLAFRPRVVTLLDVLEHFPPEEVATTLRGVLEECRELELLVVKVPIRGLLHGLARLLSLVGLQGPIRQLYQVGTWPPHLNYFSTRSVEALVRDLGLDVTGILGDADFEPALLAERMGARNRFFRFLARGAGAGLGLAIRTTRRFDTTILFARPAAFPGVRQNGRSPRRESS